jgi:hypothetical protein
LVMSITSTVVFAVSMLIRFLTGQARNFARR